MSEFITGLLLGSAFTFFITQYHKWKSCLIEGRLNYEKNGDSLQWQNIMSYDGSGKGQKRDED